MTEALVSGPLIVRDLAALELPQRKLDPYDRPIGLLLVHEDAESGVEIYVVEYPAGMLATWHRHPSAHTMLVLEGELEVNGQIIGPGALCRYPADTPMHHAPAGDGPCRFVIVFEGSSDVAVVEPPASG
jgi:quercetin dioxygenase-like cupin family protein